MWQLILFGAVGVGAGYVLGMIAPEEMHDGKKYFTFLWKILLTLILLAVGLYLFDFVSYATFLIIETVLLFLFGFPLGSLLYCKNGRKTNA